MGHPGIHKLAQISLDLKCFRGGDMQSGIQLLVADDRIDGRDHPSLDASRFQDLINKINRGCLSIRAGHPDHRQMVRWIAVKSS